VAFDLDPTYRQVPERIADLKAKHPEATLQPLDPAKPYTIETVGSQVFIVYAAACYRTPDDPRPGIGIAWEQFPGKTPYTRNSELMNAETSAWGRAIIAALASESKTVASAEEERNRRADEAAPDTAALAEVMAAVYAATTLEELREAWRRAATSNLLTLTAPKPGGGTAKVEKYIESRRTELAKATHEAAGGDARVQAEAAALAAEFAADALPPDEPPEGYVDPFTAMEQGESVGDGS